MIADAILSLIAVVVIAERHFAERGWRIERERLVSAVVARHGMEFAAIERSRDPKPRREPREPIPPPIGL